MGKMDDMGTRMDELEHSIAALLLQAGLENRVTKSSNPIESSMRVSQPKKKNPSRSSPVQSSNTLESSSSVLSQGDVVSPRTRITIEI